MSASQICIIATIVVYLVAMVLVGVYCSRKGAGGSAHEFYLGGRKLGPVVTAMSAEASDMSSYLLMGLPGLAYLCGVAEVGWTAIGLAIGTYLNWLIVAKRLRRYSAHIGAIFFIPYTASGFKAIGTLFNSLFGVNYHVAMIVGAIVVIGYTVLGGFLAVSTTDLIQSIVMTFALVFIVFFGISQAGGWESVTANATSMPGYLNLTQGYDVATNQAGSFPALRIVSTLAWGLGYFGMPHILLRFMAIEDDTKLKTSRRIATVWVVISMFIAVLIGIVGNTVTKEGKIPFLGTSSDAETILIKLSDLLSQHGVFFALVAGLALSGILASTMSTADSQLLAAASSVSHDLVQDFFGKKLSPKNSMLAARGTVIGIAVVGILLAWNPSSSVFRIVSFAWAGFGAAFGPLVLFSLFWKRTTKQGAIAGMIAGGAMVFIWKYLLAPMGGAWSIYELLPAFLVACVAIVVVSLATPAPAKEIVEEFEGVGK